MPFPLKVGDHDVPDPPALAALVRRDAGPVSGGVIAGKRPHQWLAELVATGALEHRLAVGLAAALLQHPVAETVCEGARLAVGLADRVLGTVLLRALEAHDTALLLRADPADPASSVEDVLLGAAAGLCDVSDEAVRGPLLERLRHAGLPRLEVPILAAWGTVHELRTWLPAVLAEGVTDAGVASLAERVARGDEGAEAVREILADHPDIASRVG
jgi:hypothetical protein